MNRPLALYQVGGSEAAIKLLAQNPRALVLYEGTASPSLLVGGACPRAARVLLKPMTYDPAINRALKCESISSINEPVWAYETNMTGSEVVFALRNEGIIDGFFDERPELEYVPI